MLSNEFGHDLLMFHLLMIGKPTCAIMFDLDRWDVCHTCMFLGSFLSDNLSHFQAFLVCACEQNNNIKQVCSGYYG